MTVKQTVTVFLNNRNLNLRSDSGNKCTVVNEITAKFNSLLVPCMVTLYEFKIFRVYLVVAFNNMN